MHSGRTPVAHQGTQCAPPVPPVRRLNDVVGQRGEGGSTLCDNGRAKGAGVTGLEGRSGSRYHPKPKVSPRRTQGTPTAPSVPRPACGPVRWSSNPSNGLQTWGSERRSTPSAARGPHPRGGRSGCRPRYGSARGASACASRGGRMCRAGVRRGPEVEGGQRGPRAGGCMGGKGGIQWTTHALCACFSPLITCRAHAGRVSGFGDRGGGGGTEAEMDRWQWGPPPPASSLSSPSPSPSSSDNSWSA